MTPREIILQLKDNRLVRGEILNYFLKSPRTIEELIQLALSKDEYPIQEHAGWILIHATLKKPKEIEKYHSQIIDCFLDMSPKNINEIGNQYVLRNLCKILSEFPLIEHRDGELLDQLILHFKNLDNKVALHVYSLHKINQFIKKHPEIKPEIEEILNMKRELGLAPSLRQVARDFDKLYAKIN